MIKIISGTRQQHRPLFQNQIDLPLMPRNGRGRIGRVRVVASWGHRPNRTEGIFARNEIEVGIHIMEAQRVRMNINRYDALLLIDVFKNPEWRRCWQCADSIKGVLDAP